MKSTLAVLLTLALASPVVAQNADKKTSIPADTAQAEATKLVKEVYGEEYAKAKTAAEKQALAKKLLGKANESTDDPSSQFVLLRIARDIATQASDEQTAFEAIDAMAEAFQIDANEMKSVVLTKFAATAQKLAQHKTIAEEALKLVDQAVSQDNFKVADELGKLALAEARKAREKELTAQAQGRISEVTELVKSYEEVKAARAALEKAPDDPDANLIVGKYLCFVKGDWDRGLPMLALGKDKDLKALAMQELQGAVSSKEQAKLGDGWWGVAEKQEGTAKKQMQARAGHWYQEALPGLSGLMKDKVEKRLMQLTSTGERTVDKKPRLLQTKTQLMDGHPNHAKFDGMSFDVGIGDEPWGVGIGAVGYELENIKIVRTEVKINGTLHPYDRNGYVGFIVDYHTPEGYSKRVALSLGMYSTDRDPEHTPNWGKGAKADQFVDLGNWRSGKLNLKEWAPRGWDGRVWFGILLQHSGKNTSMTGRLVIPGSGSQAISSPEQPSPDTLESTTKPAFTTNKGAAGWIVIFCSSDPSLWDTNTKHSPTDFAKALTSVSDGIRYLRMRAVGVNDPVIISISKDRLGKDTKEGRYGWSGDKSLESGWFHIGIYDSNINVRHQHDHNLNPHNFGRIYVDHGGAGGDGGGGYGFGSMWGRENEKSQAWTWGGYEIPKTVMEIAVKSSDLSKKEQKFLLK